MFFGNAHAGIIAAAELEAFGHPGDYSSGHLLFHFLRHRLGRAPKHDSGLAVRRGLKHEGPSQFASGRDSQIDQEFHCKQDIQWRKVYRFHGTQRSAPEKLKNLAINSSSYAVFKTAPNSVCTRPADWRIPFITDKKYNTFLQGNGKIHVLDCTGDDQARRRPSIHRAGMAGDVPGIIDDGKEGVVGGNEIAIPPFPRQWRISRSSGLSFGTS